MRAKIAAGVTYGQAFDYFATWAFYTCKKNGHLLRGRAFEKEDNSFAREHMSIFLGSRNSSSELYLVISRVGACMPVPCAINRALVIYQPGSSYKQCSSNLSAWL